MSKDLLIKKISEYVKGELGNESGDHDWWHAYRVWQLAKKINKKEKGDDFVVEAAALLHDVADRKLNNNDSEVGLKKVENFLKSLSLKKDEIKKILFIIKYMSFSSRQPKTKTLELKVVQDADRLDALGAIGVARVFSYSGKCACAFYDPGIKVKKISKSQYKQQQSSAISHFYEKILKLKDLMNTATGKKIARRRHEFIEKYLKEFFKEWNGEV